VYFSLHFRVYCIYQFPNSAPDIFPPSVYFFLQLHFLRVSPHHNHVCGPLPRFLPLNTTVHMQFRFSVHYFRSICFVLRPLPHPCVPSGELPGGGRPSVPHPQLSFCLMGTPLFRARGEGVRSWEPFFPCPQDPSRIRWERVFVAVGAGDSHQAVLLAAGAEQIKCPAWASPAAG